MKLDSLKPIGLNRLKSHIARGKEAQRNGRWSEAYQAYSTALRQDSRRFGLLVQMGHMSKEMGEFERAEAHYLEAMELKPDDWDLHLQLGHLFNRSGDVDKAKYWYVKANVLEPTPEVNDYLHAIEEGHAAKDTRELRRLALEQVDSRRFKAALPNVLDLYERHGLRDFDVIVGHVYRELGRYSEAKGMYVAYFDRCLASNNRHLRDAFWHLMNVLEILEERKEILKIFARLKQHYIDSEAYSDFNSEQAELLKSHVGKLYGVFRT